MGTGRRLEWLIGLRFRGPHCRSGSYNDRKSLKSIIVSFDRIIYSLVLGGAYTALVESLRLNDYAKSRRMSTCFLKIDWDQPWAESPLAKSLSSILW